MSSFEPLFGKSGRTRLTPRTVVPIATASTWMPIQVGGPARNVHAFFDATGDNIFGASGSALYESDEAAAAQLRQAEIDAAFARGVADGREQGEQAERARLRGATLATERALDVVRDSEARWLANIEANISAIAVAVAQQIVSREVTTATDIVLDIATRAVQEFGLDQPLTIRVNPGDLESLQSTARADADAMSDVAKGREVRWVSDARIEPGGCVVEGRERIVDGRVDTALERLYRRLAHTNA